VTNQSEGSLILDSLFRISKELTLPDRPNFQAPSLAGKLSPERGAVPNGPVLSTTIGVVKKVARRLPRAQLDPVAVAG
jgi:hypothetical protein